MKINKDYTMAEATAKDYIKHYWSMVITFAIDWWDTIGGIFEDIGDDEEDVWYDSRNDNRNNILDSGCRSFILCMWKGVNKWIFMKNY